MEALAEHISGIRYGVAFAGLALAVIALQIVTLVRARRRRSTGDVRLQIWAGLAILTLPIFAGVSVHAARAEMLSAVAATDPSTKGAALGDGITGQINAIPLAISTTAVAATLWLLGLAAAPRSGSQSSFPRAALASIGLVAIAVGGLRWSTGIIKELAALAGIPHEQKPARLLATLDIERRSFELFAWISRVTIIGLVLLAVALALFDRAAGRGSVPSRRPYLVGSAAALVMAAILFIAARPMRAENELAWPPIAGGAFLASAEPSTPDLVGPDELERAPVIQLFADHIALDGAVREFEDLETMLVTLRTNFNLLHGGEPFNHTAVLVCDARVSAKRLLAVLTAMHDAGDGRPLLAFAKRESVVRPTFGRLERVRATAARIVLADATDRKDDIADLLAGAEGVSARAPALSDFDDLARRAVAARASGKVLVLNLGQ